MTEEIDYRRIYRERASDYDRLVTAEDRAGNISGLLRAFLPADPARVLEIGAGTGRLTRLLVPFASRIVAMDVARPMLSVARARQPASEHRIRWMVADGRTLPVRTGWADIAIAGWVFGHLTEWSRSAWRRDIGAAIDELCRAARRGCACARAGDAGYGHRAAGSADREPRRVLPVAGR